MNKPTPNQPSTKEPKNEIKLTPIKSTSPILDKAIKEHIPYPVPKQNDKPNEPVVGEFQLPISPCVKTYCEMSLYFTLLLTTSPFR